MKEIGLRGTRSPSTPTPGLSMATLLDMNCAKYSQVAFEFAVNVMPGGVAGFYKRSEVEICQTSQVELRE